MLYFKLIEGANASDWADKLIADLTEGGHSYKLKEITSTHIILEVS